MKNTSENKEDFWLMLLAGFMVAIPAAMVGGLLWYAVYFLGQSSAH